MIEVIEHRKAKGRGVLLQMTGVKVGVGLAQLQRQRIIRSHQLFHCSMASMLILEIPPRKRTDFFDKAFNG